MQQDNLAITATASYLLVEFSGQFNVAAGKGVVDTMAAACEEYGRSRVLLDCRKMTGAMPVFDRFEVAEYGAGKRNQIGRLALLNRADVLLPDNFVENVAVNRGMDVKIFTDFDEAETWLTATTPPPDGHGTD